MNIDFDTLPTFVVCGCGKETTSAPCWSCLERTKQKLDHERLSSKRNESIPERFKGLTLEIVKARCASYARIDAFTKHVNQNPRKSFTFVGHAGCGKTTLAVWAMMQGSRNGMFIRATDPENARFGRDNSDLLKVYKSIDVLVIDEVRDHEKTLFDIIDERHNRMLATYITTGMSKEQIKDEGLQRRMFESQCSGVVQVGGAK